MSGVCANDCGRVLEHNATGPRLCETCNQNAWLRAFLAVAQRERDEVRAALANLADAVPRDVALRVIDERDEAIARGVLLWEYAAELGVWFDCALQWGEHEWERANKVEDDDE